MRDRGIGSWIERWAGIAPERPAVSAGDTTRSYAELAGRVTRLANGLRGLGVQRGDRVAWLGPNHSAFLETMFAVAKLGAVLSPVNHRLGPDVIASILADSEPRLAVTVGNLLPASDIPRVTVGGTDEESGYEHLIAEAPDDPIDEPISLEDLCLLPYTSGTTGASKGVMLTHGNMIWNAVNLLTRADFRGDDVTVAIAPFFRTGGIGVNVTPVLFKGGRVVIPRAVEPDEILRLMESHRVTVGFGNPDLLEAMSRSPHWPTVDLSSIRFIITGGAPVPERLLHVYLDRGVTLLQGYGLTEAAPGVLLLDPETAARKPGSAGRPLLLDDIRLVHQDGTECKPGETGELLVSGPNVMAGYWKRPEATRRVLDGAGWLHTGDAVRMDEGGDLWIVDRVSDGYVVGDRVVYPGDVERVLARHPAVVEAGAVGLGDDRQGGMAFVVLTEPGAVTEMELLDLCRANLPSYAVPLAIAFVPRLPRTSVGKLLRPELRQMAEAVPQSKDAAGIPPRPVTSG